MYNKGKWQHRFKSDPNEKLIAKLWENENKKHTHGVLDYLLAEDPNHPKYEATDRDREVAATVIQWLGSPVGSYFLKEYKKQKK